MKTEVIKLLKFDCMIRCTVQNKDEELKMAMIYGEENTFRVILRIGSTMLRASTVPQVTLGSKGVNAK